ncbi:TetR family transcriptional regulator [Corynebacterium godavarianum]|uniref:TetR family transcriptional regulator n=1 Tax=Corynebacterium godavarianum TaxID=2054421 RepID=A0ABY3E769_9CORY|nr:TetR/AcrR family transcriptional regulator [Corynebacterium godavarianum]MBL7285554.1 TetR family transcriptional regulator [Corynebacterium godavarianum]TSJ75585.1 TetR family transcriptional regulator [Corynebacterium godavarianum]
MQNSQSSANAWEVKRQRTRQRIFKAAMDLVEAHGIDNTTVEDICQAADISRRTFFNYMDSKDHAILGAFPFDLTEDGLEAIASTPSDNLVALIIESLEEHPEAADQEHLARRRKLLHQHVELESAAMVRKREAMKALWRAVDKHFAQHPQDRKLDGPVEEEIHAVVEIFFFAVSRYLHLPERPEGTLKANLLRAGAMFTEFTKELKWNNPVTPA